MIVKLNDLKNEKINSLIKLKVLKSKNKRPILLLGKENEILMLTTKTESSLYDIKENDVSMCLLDYTDGNLKTKIVLQCDYTIHNDTNSLYLEYISLYGTNNISKGYGTIMINYIESIAKSKNLNYIDGYFMPMKITDDYMQKVSKFYLRNGFIIKKVDDEKQIFKSKEKFRNIDYEKYRGIKIGKTFLTKIEDKMEETEDENLL